MIVWLASYPRSGNSFLRAVVHGFFGQPSAEKYNLAGRKPCHYGYSSPYSLAELEARPELFFIKTHDLPQGDTHRAIYLFRDGRDVLVSYAWYVLEIEKRLDRAAIDPLLFRTTLHDLMLDQRSPFGTWSQNVLSWLDRPRTVSLKFEEFIQTPEKIIEAVERLKLSLHPCEHVVVPTFESLQKLHPDAFRRGKVGSWLDDFPPDLLDLFWRAHGKACARLGYDSDDRAYGIRRLIRGMPSGRHGGREWRCSLG